MLQYQAKTLKSQCLSTAWGLPRSQSHLVLDAQLSLPHTFQHCPWD